MSESSTHHEEEYTRKRGRLENGYEDIASTNQLSHEQYTVGWICAIPVELAAAKAMLDVEHIPPQTSGRYHNIYTVGSMNGHNIVIACLPDGSYGTTSAAVVAEHMMRDFTSIEIPLMVGIGGGVPTHNHDIRLGDVVIGTPTSECSAAVVQYDFGKTGLNGMVAQKGSLNNPKPFLLKAVANMKATHQTSQSRVPEYISGALQQLSVRDGYTYPGAENDTFYELICSPNQDQCNSATCTEERRSVRATRAYSTPHIHYGPIASGNQVMKDAHTRDRLAKDFKVLCFEMEAAGIMNEHQFLVIRGICDYCDTHKNKRFQGYAALAAAATAKELLSILPKRGVARRFDITQIDMTASEHRKTLWKALKSEEWDSKKATLKKAHKQTCKWFLVQQEYLDWLNEDLFNQHHGLLWIKGKPGAGKSTIMKFVSEEISKQKPDAILISFFFHARGHDQENSIVGMYRSLVYQLIQTVPELQSLLDNKTMNSDTFNQSHLELLKDLFSSAVESLSSKHLICFVDALDECPEHEVREMVDFFSELAISQSTFHVLFSSRHYPNITIDTEKILTLEDQDGHSQDILRYINAELKIGNNKQTEKLKEQILTRSSGIFLWVVLVVRILRSEHDKGRVRTLDEKLQEIPTELDGLFRDIIIRDGQQLPEFILCMQWVLYAARPLRREELYFALLVGNDSTSVPRWDPDIETPLIMNSLILDTSKGLAEITRSQNPTVQFIHESVREFLLKPDALIGLHHGFQDISRGWGHQRLRECCERQIYSDALTTAATSFQEMTEGSFPFLSYAVEYGPHHAEQAECSGISQLQYMRTLLRSPWVAWHNVSQSYSIWHVSLEDGEDVALLCYLAMKSLQNLLLSFLGSYSPLTFEDTVNQAGKLLLQAKKFDGFSQLCKALSACATSRDLATVLPLVEVEYDRALNAAILDGNSSAVELLIEAGVKINAPVGSYSNASHIAAAISKENGLIVKMLIEAGADVNGQGTEYGTALRVAAAEGHDWIVKILIKAGADINAQAGFYGNALQTAAIMGHDSVVKVLIEAGADINAQGGRFGTALQAAAILTKDDSIVKMLIEAGADVNVQSGLYGNALQAAIRKGCDSIVKMLIEAGADNNAQGR